jgi:hypothetical protein
MTIDLDAIKARVERRAEVGKHPFMDNERMLLTLRLADDVPALLAEVKRLRTENADWREGFTREAGGAYVLREKVAVMDRLLNAPRYSTEAVEALLAACDAITKDDTDPLRAVSNVLYARDAVRASREPAK